MTTWKSAAYEGRYLQLTISETVNTAANTSTLKWTPTSTGGSVSYYTVDETTVTINGTQVYHKARTSWDSKVFPAATGSTSGSLTISHNADGSKTIAVGFSTRVYVFGPQEYGGNMTPTKIDRFAPTITFSATNIAANGFKISSSASATCDTWQYSTNNGSSWTTFSSTAGTSASTTLSSLSPNTSYTVKVRARKKSNQVYGTSSAITVKTLGASVVNSVSSVTADASTVSISINMTVYNAAYMHSLAIKNGSTTYLTITGLSWAKGTGAKTVTLTTAQMTTLLTAMKSIKSEKKMKPNEGEVPQYYVEGSHPAIIEPDEWDHVQAEFARRKALGRTYSGKSVLSAKLVCEDCGGFFVSKVLHSTNQYRRTIWQCNSKFSNEKRCHTPVLDTETVQQLFVKAYNQMMQNRRHIIADCELMRRTLTNFDALDANIERQIEETQVVAELVQAVVKENASKAQSQEAYLKKYKALTKRYETASAELERLQKQQTLRQQQDKAMALFICALRKQPEVLDARDDTIWTVMVEKTIVHRDGKITFVFYNGTEIKVGP